MDTTTSSSDPFDPTSGSVLARIAWGAVVLLVLGVLSLPLLRGFFMSRPDTIVTLQDFKSQVDCLDCLNQHLPMPLPGHAIVSEFEYVSWLDWDLNATIELAEDPAIKYVQSIQVFSAAGTDSAAAQASASNSATYVIRGEVSMSGSVAYDEETGLLTIECGNLL